jgi:hypothetical protein
MPEPITIAAVGAGSVGAWAWLKGKFANPVPPPPSCDTARIQQAAQQTAGGAVQGAAAGSAAPGVGTAAGAGVGAGLALTGILSGPCGSALGKAISDAARNAGKSACEKADMVYNEIKKKGGDIPGYSHMSCDQKLAAALAAASPLGVVVVGITTAVGSALSLGKKGVAVVSRVASDAADATSGKTSVGTTSTTVAGHKLW